MPPIKPPRLKKGDVVGLVSPAGTPRPREKIESAARYLEARGYRVEVGAHAASEHGYLAGTDEERAADLNGMIRDDRVSAIFSLRGGYGSSRILERIDYRALKRSPKIITGFSDITALQLALYRKIGLVTFSGPLPAVEFWRNPDPYSEEHFWRLVTSARVPGKLPNPPGAPTWCVRRGRVEGILLGGNLALVCATVGTPYCPSFRDALLVLEDVEESPYRVDRMLTHLRNAGIAGRAKGAIFGQFTRCEPKDSSVPFLPVPQILEDFTERTGLPAFANFQYGHVAKKLTVPFGLAARMDAARGTIEVLEAAVE